MSKQYSDSNLETVVYNSNGEQHSYLLLSVDRDDYIDAPMWFHKQGLRQTASGYGRKLNTGLKLSFNGRLHRVYCSIFSNSGTNYIISKGRRIICS